MSAHGGGYSQEWTDDRHTRNTRSPNESHHQHEDNEDIGFLAFDKRHFQGCDGFPLLANLYIHA
jgi:hypothetical protein